MRNPPRLARRHPLHMLYRRDRDPDLRGRLFAGYRGCGCQQAQSGLDQCYADPAAEPDMVEGMIAGLGGGARRG